MWAGSPVYPGYYDQAQPQPWQPWGGLQIASDLQFPSDLLPSQGETQPPQNVWPSSSSSVPGLSPTSAAIFGYPAPAPLVVSVDTVKTSPSAQVGHEPILSFEMILMSFVFRRFLVFQVRLPSQSPATAVTVAA